MMIICSLCSLFVFPASAQKKDQFPKAPVLKATEMVQKKTIAAEDKLDAAIETLQQLIETADDSDPQKPEYIARLAESYWDKAEFYFAKAYGDEMFMAINKAQVSGNTAEQERLLALQNEYLNKKIQWQGETIKTYEMIIQKYSSYKNLDSVLYYLGFTLTLIGKAQEGMEHLTRILKEYPNSLYLADTLLNIGEFYFNTNQFPDALKVYRNVENFPQSNAYGLALYKQGWCHYNLREYDKSLDKFLAVIKYAESEQSKETPYRDLFKKEAQRDLVMVYTQVGSIEKAISFFKGIAPNLYMTLSEKLAEGYSDQGSFDKSNKLYKYIIREDPKSIKILSYQRAILENTYKIGVKIKVAEEGRRLTALMEQIIPKADDKFLEDEIPRIEKVMRLISTAYHKEYEKTKDNSTKELTLHLYSEYLKHMKDSSEFYNMTMNNALMLYAVGKNERSYDIFEKAASMFERVIAIDPQGKSSADAAHYIVTSYLNMMEMKPIHLEIKSDTELAMEKKEIPPLQMKMVSACDRFVQIEKKESEDVPRVLIAAAKIYYNFNHFDETISRLKKYFENYENDESAEEAAKLILSAFHLSRSIRDLNDWAARFDRNPKINQGELAVIIKTIKDSAEYNKCYEFEGKNEFIRAAKCFREYVVKFPDTKLYDKAMINAGNNYFKAKNVQEALKVNEDIFNNRPDSDLAPKALFNIGEIYRRLAVYSEAARIYEFFADKYSKHENTEEALRYATIFRRGLGEYDAAIKDLTLYLKLFPSSKHAANIFFDIGMIYYKQKKYKPALEHFRKYLGKYGESGGNDLKLRAYLMIGSTYWAMGMQKDAVAEYQNTLKAFNELPADIQEKLGPDGFSAGAEAQFMIGEKILSEVRAIKLKLPEKVLQELIAKKLSLMKDAMTAFDSVEKYMQPHWTIAAYAKKGDAYKELAELIETAPLSKNLSKEAQDMQKSFLLEQAVPIWEKARSEYKNCVELAQKLKWFNQYSEEAEENLRKLEPAFKTLPDFRFKAGFYTPNPNPPDFADMKDPLSWEDKNLEQKIAKLRTDSQSADSIFNAGLYAEFNGRLEEARSFYEKALKLKPGYLKALVRTAVVHMKQGRLEKSKEIITEAMKSDEHNVMGNNLLSYISIMEKRYADALNHARLVLVSDPDNLNAYLNLVIAYYELGLYDVGLLVCRNALSIKADDPYIMNMSGLISLRKNEIRQAVSLFEKAIKAKENLVDAYLNLGSITLAYKDYTSAETDFNKVLKIEPLNLSGLVNLSIAQRRLDKKEDTKKTYDLILQNYPDNAEVHFNLCIYYQENLQNYLRALDECTIFLNKTDKNHAKFKDAQSRLKDLEILRESTGTKK
jgi:tetratricopeptide (TPR) repeat protein